MICERCRRNNSPYPMEFDRMAAICFLALFVSFLQVTDAKLSDYTTICNTKDPNLNECMKKSTQKMFSYFKTGIKELNVPVLDPYTIPMMEMGSDSPGPVMMKLTLTNATHYGFSKAKVKKIEGNPAKYWFDIYLHIPRYEIISNYDISGKVLMMPVKGKDVSNTTLLDLDVIWKVRGEPETVDGKTYFKLTKLENQFTIKKMFFNFGNLFNGNKEMSNMFNKLVNEHWEELFNQMKPIMQQNNENNMRRLAKRIHSTVAYSDVFPDLFENQTISQ